LNDGSDIPRARLSFIHQFFSGTRAATASVVTPPVPIYPPIPSGRPAVAHTLPFFAGPLFNPATTGIRPRPVYPDVLTGPPRIAHTFQFFAGPTANTLVSLGFPGYGSAGAATFALSLEPGTKVTYSWGTDIFKSYSGLERRCNTSGPMPRQRFEGNAFLLDGTGRDLRSTLQRAAAAGSTFLLALPHEELVTTADATGTTLHVSSTTACDWAIVTQRVTLEGVDGSNLQAVIQAVDSTTLQLDIVPGITGSAGARIMPLVQVLLDPQQGFSRYLVNVELWSIRAMASVFGWVGQDRMGIGTQILTYAGGLVAISSLTESDLLIWNRSNAVDGTSSESLLSLADLVDLGGLPFGAGPATVPDWARPIRYSSADPVDFQWLKAFLRQLRGRQRTFLLTTSHADLIFVSAAGATLKVQSSSVTGAGDYTSWYASLAHRRFALTKTNGTIQYVAVTTAPTDNHDGTLSLALDATVTGTVAVVSFLEQVRLDNSDSDDIPVTWDGGVFSVELLARVVQM
jgi:hypothetical protein